MVSPVHIKYLGKLLTTVNPLNLIRSQKIIIKKKLWATLKRFLGWASFIIRYGTYVYPTSYLTLFFSESLKRT